MPTMQSAYRRFHSTETAVLKIYSGLLFAAYNRDVSVLCLLDLTAAFDTIYHDLIMFKLECQSGLHGVVLDWFRSYLCGRTYRVIHGGKTSYNVHVICSMAQGSVLGPRMFILYASDLEDVAAKHSANIHGYADDTQLYLHGRRDDTMPTVHRLESCITGVSQWMSTNRLKLNTNKTELLWHGPRHSQSSLSCCDLSLQLGRTPSRHKTTSFCPRVTISSDLSLQCHISNVPATSFHWLRQLRRVR